MSLGMLTFCVEGMKPSVEIPGGNVLMWFLLVRSCLLKMCSENGWWETQGGLKRVPVDTQGHGFLQMWNNNTHQFGGSGNVVPCSAEWALSFPCWLRSGAFTGHPYCCFSIMATPQTCTASRESVLSVYGDKTPYPTSPRLGWLTKQILSGFWDLMYCCRGNCLSRNTEGFGREYFFTVSFRLPRVSVMNDFLCSIFFCRGGKCFWFF